MIDTLVNVFDSKNSFCLHKQQSPYAATAAVTSTTVLIIDFVFFRSNLFCLNDASKISNFPREINGINNLDLTHPIVQIVWERQEEQFSCYHLSKVWMLAILDFRKFN